MWFTAELWHQWLKKEGANMYRFNKAKQNGCTLEDVMKSSCLRPISVWKGHRQSPNYKPKVYQFVIDLRLVSDLNDFYIRKVKGSSDAVPQDAHHQWGKYPFSYSSLSVWAAAPPAVEPLMFIKCSALTGLISGPIWWTQRNREPLISTFYRYLMAQPVIMFRWQLHFVWVHVI